MVVKQFGWGIAVKALPRNGYVMSVGFAVRCKFSDLVDFTITQSVLQIVWVLYGQASRAISTG